MERRAEVGEDSLSLRRKMANEKVSLLQMTEGSMSSDWIFNSGLSPAFLRCAIVCYCLRF